MRFSACYEVCSFFLKFSTAGMFSKAFNSFFPPYNDVGVPTGPFKNIAFLSVLVNESQFYSLHHVKHHISILFWCTSRFSYGASVVLVIFAPPCAHSIRLKGHLLSLLCRWCSVVTLFEMSELHSLLKCLDTVKHWTADSFLELNQDKTEIIHFAPEKCMLRACWGCCPSKQKETAFCLVL